MSRSFETLKHAYFLYLAARHDRLQGQESSVEITCSRAFQACSEAMEQAVAGRLQEILKDEYEKQLGRRPKLYQLLEKFQPELPEDLKQSVIGCHKRRNHITHDAQLAALQELEQSLEVARVLFTDYCDAEVDYGSMKAALPKSMEAITLSYGPVVDVRLSEQTNRQRVFLVSTPKSEGNALRDGQLVEVEFNEKKPSKFWADPYCKIRGIVDSNGEVRRYASFSVFVDQGAPIEMKNLNGLCIPTYDVPAEFRELLYVREPMWRSIKQHVVEKVFLAEQSSKTIQATTIKLRTPERQQRGVSVEPILTCTEYIDALKKEWKGYKALEDALSLGRLYKNPRIQECNADQIRTYVLRELIDTGLIHKLLKPSEIESRFYEAEYVSRVFYGLVNRYRFLASQPWASRSLESHS